MNKTKLKTSLFIVSSFLIPAIMMFFIYLSQGIYWNSDTSPLLGDGYHQYVIFDTTLRNILHGTDSLFYSFQSGLGINFYALSSYYLGSFFSPLVYFFNAQSMPDAVYLITLFKLQMKPSVNILSERIRHKYCRRNENKRKQCKFYIE